MEATILLVRAQNLTRFTTMNTPLPSKDSTEPLKSALQLADSGLPVFPVEPNGKRPFSHLVKHGFKDATTEEVKIRDWWRTLPSANVGVVTGDVFVVDIDVKGEADGIARWNELAEGREVPATRTVRTPSGGLHLYFRAPDGVDVRCSNSRLADGIDVKGNGGYVLAPPSSTETGPYTYVSEDPIAEAPEWLLNEIAVSRGESSNRAEPVEDVIPEGQRNDTLTSLAGTMRHRGMSESEMRVALAAINEQRCHPSLPGEEVQSIARSVAQYPPGEVNSKNDEGDKQNRGKTQAQHLLEMASDIDLFHTPKGRAFATFERNGTWRTAAISSSLIADHLRQLFYDAEDRPPSSQALQDAKEVLRARALFDGPEREVHVRVAGHADRIYIDLTNDKWEVVEIDASGWRVISSAEAPVRFRRVQGMKPMPRPVDGGSLGLLRRHVPVQDDEAFALLLAFLVQSLCPFGPYPVLEITGEQGSGKTTVVKIIRSCVDPSLVPIRSRPRNERDLVIAAENGWMLVFDNLSGLADWLSDAFCRLATGGGFGTRKLYENREEELFYALRPVVMNGIDDLTTRGDLADRSITLRLSAIDPEERRTESDVWAAFKHDQPAILGALFTAVSTALRRVDDVSLNRMPRMADFAKWIVAAEPALPIRSGAFMSAYAENRASARKDAVANDVVGAAIVALLGDAEDGTWTGKMSTLLEDLKPYLSNPERPPRNYPDSYQAMGAHLRRIMPALREVGIEKEEDPRARSTAFTLRKEESKTDRSEPMGAEHATDESGLGGAAERPERVQGAREQSTATNGNERKTPMERSESGGRRQRIQRAQGLPRQSTRPEPADKRRRRPEVKKERRRKPVHAVDEAHAVDAPPEETNDQPNFQRGDRVETPAFTGTVREVDYSEAHGEWRVYVRPGGGQPNETKPFSAGDVTRVEPEAE